MKEVSSIGEAPEYSKHGVWGDRLEPIQQENAEKKATNKSGQTLGTNPSEEHPIGGPLLGGPVSSKEKKPTSEE